MTQAYARERDIAVDVRTELVSLGFSPSSLTSLESALRGADAVAPNAPWRTRMDALIERALESLPLDFDALPVLIEGESKVVKLWTPEVVVERFKPTVYSFTHNRCGIAPGTEAVRARFAAEVFRRMNAAADLDASFRPRSGFLGLIEDARGPLVVQRRVTSCNLEVRVKRYHIGSPLHRYRYTERYPTTQGCGPLRKWSRLDVPVVCFDWRHPMSDEEGARLADEPISDDYAAVWMEAVPYAKEMARQAFIWLEELFGDAGFILVDLCFFVDRTGHLFFGEVSPDCMRIRVGSGDLANADALDKDVWRNGGTPEALVERYNDLLRAVFGPRLGAHK